MENMRSERTNDIPAGQQNRALLATLLALVTPSCELKRQEEQAQDKAKGEANMRVAREQALISNAARGLLPHGDQPYTPERRTIFNDARPGGIRYVIMPEEFAKETLRMEQWGLQPDGAYIECRGINPEEQKAMGILDRQAAAIVAESMAVTTAIEGLKTAECATQTGTTFTVADCTVDVTGIRYTTTSLAGDTLACARAYRNNSGHRAERNPQ